MIHEYSILGQFPNACNRGRIKIKSQGKKAQVFLPLGWAVIIPKHGVSFPFSANQNLTKILECFAVVDHEKKKLRPPACSTTDVMAVFRTVNIGIVPQDK